MVLFWLVTLPKARADQNYWVYLPTPPLLHPVTWEDRRVPIYINDTKILGLPSDDHIWYQKQDNYTYSGLSMHQPICFTTNASSSSCIYLQHTSEGDGSVTAPGTHWDVDFLYPVMNCSARGPGIPPQRVKACSGQIPSSNFGIEWTTCHSNETVCNDYICDWAKYSAACQPTEQTAGLWTSNNRTWQTDLWKLTASLGYITISKANVSKAPSGVISGSGSSWNVSVRACVPEPYALLVGSIIISTDNNTGVITTNCTACILTNCINQTSQDVVILIQPAFVFLPVNLTGPWYDDTGLAVIQQIQNQLSRGKRFIGLLIVRITAVLVCIIILVLLCSCRMLTSQFSQVYVEMKHLQLQQDKDKPIPLHIL